MNGFQIQVRSISNDIWVIPSDRYDFKKSTVQSERISTLRDTIQWVADHRTLGFAMHVRIVTDDGDPVERWIVRPGSMKKLKRRY